MKIRIEDVYYSVALIAMFYVLGVVSGMSEFDTAIGQGMPRCVIGLLIAAFAVRQGYKFERAKH